jgi:hypothetical protein
MVNRPSCMTERSLLLEKKNQPASQTSKVMERNVIV